jgi:phenylacetate-CoA ligase
MKSLLPIYHRLPPSVRSMAASLRGFYLRSWRYDESTDAWAKEAAERERWTSGDWDQWRSDRLGYVLERAATRVPYYRNYWSGRRRAGHRESWLVLEHWPELGKEPLRENPRAFVAEDCDPAHMFHEHTSGTTGKSLDLWWSRETVQTWYAWMEARWRQWYGVSRHDRWAILGGQLVVPVAERRPPFWVWNAGLKQLYLSSYHLAPDLIPHYLDALAQYHVKYLWGYSSALYSLAQETVRLGRGDLKMQVAITNAEPICEYQRETITAAFQCPVRETYGMSEIVAAAGECELGRLHQWPEAGHIEVWQGNEPVRAGEEGDFICTGLLNADMPLIRYRVGDRGVLAPEGTGCGCGRTLPVILRIEGRSDDVLLTRDGRRVGRLDPIFKSKLPIREAQIIQETLDRVRVRYIPAPEFKKGTEELLAELLRQRLGEMQVICEPVSELPRTSNGKFRAVICQIPSEERALAGSARQPMKS